MRRSSRSAERRPNLLDVGARRSPYTIGLNADVTLLDIPRTTEEQNTYDLGATAGIPAQTARRRANVKNYLLVDFLANNLRPKSYDVVTTVEVIEHIEDDRLFVRELSRVVADDGFVFLTTPNGDAMPTPFPQHVRHYKASELR